MKPLFHTLWLGIREPFKKKNYTSFFLILLAVMFALFVFIPVWTVPGNTLATQLDIFAFRDYAVLVLLSSLSSLFITMQIYVMRQKRKMKGVSAAAGGGLGALFAGIAGTAFLRFVPRSIIRALWHRIRRRDFCTRISSLFCHRNNTSYADCHILNCAKDTQGMYIMLKP